MSENLASDLRTFLRYTIPGFSLTVSILLTMPIHLYRFLPVQISDPAFLALILLFLFLALGWISYHVVFPIWVRFLKNRFFKNLVYPRSRIHSAIDQAMAKQKVKTKAAVVWSYILWTKVDGDLRSRVKLVADYSHSLYLFAFILMVALPVSHVTVSLLARQPNLISVAAQRTSAVANVHSWLAEAGIVAASLAVGSVSLLAGRERLEFCDELQLLAYQSIENDIAWERTTQRKTHDQ